MAAGALSLLVGCAAAALVHSLAPDRLTVKTDIVGYPIHTDFNVYRYVWVYAAVAGAFPAAAAAAFVALSRFGPLRRDHRLAPSHAIEGADEGDEAAASIRAAAGGPASRAVIGVTMIVEATAIWSESVWPVILVVVAALSWLVVPGFVSQREPRIRRLVARVHVLAAPIAVLGLAGVARASRIVETGGTVRRLGWFPVPVAFAVAVTIATILFVVWHRRGRSEDAVSSLERSVVIWVYGSLFVMLLQLSVPSTIGVMDTFHEGEFLAGARLTADGRVPWRDLYSVHGLLQDVMFPLAGFHLIEASRWGVVAATDLVLLPLYWVVVWAFAASFVRHNLMLLTALALVLVSDAFPHHHMRFVLTPIAFLLLRCLLERATVARAAAFVGVLAVQAILVPETAYVVLVALGAVVLFDATGRGGGSSLADRFRRTWLSVAAGAFWTVVIVGALAAAAALAPFFEYVRGVSRGHVLTGGIPVQWDQVGGRDLPWPVIVPVAVVVGSFGYVALRVGRGRSVTVNAWVLVAHAAFVGLYFTKFLGRADAHIYQVVGVTMPVLYAIGVCAILSLDRAVRPRWPWPRLSVASCVALVVALAAATGAIQRVGALPDEIEGAGYVSEIPRLGYSSEDAIDPALLDDVERLTRGALGPGGSVYDFTNNPAIFGFLLGGALDPPTRYYHVSLAIRREAQAELVEDLEERRPTLVAYHHPNLGLAMWDGIPNAVRHYDVSAYLLEHYRPYGEVGGFSFLVRNDAVVPPLGSLGPFQRVVREGPPLNAMPPCAWGAAPQFLDMPFGRGIGDVVPASVQEVRTFRGWARDPRPGARVRMVVAVRGGAVVARATIGRERIDVPADEESRLTGFDLTVRDDNVTSSIASTLRVFAVSDAGVASELPMGQATGIVLAADRPSLPAFRVDDEVIQTEPGLVEGHVDSFVEQTVATYEITPEQQRSTAAIDFGPLEPGFWTLESDVGSLRSAVTFSPTRRVPSFVVPVASCPQWHWATSGRFYLRAEVGQEPPPLTLLGPVARTGR